MAAAYAVDKMQVRKCFLSACRYQEIYKEGGDGKEIEKIAREKRKHREGRLAPEQRQVPSYDRDRFNRCKF